MYSTFIFSLLSRRVPLKYFAHKVAPNKMLLRLGHALTAYVGMDVGMQTREPL
jgi:hypothetical protein